MFRLKVVAGPNQGAVFPLREGENSLGRQGDNVIILPSAKVSKRHCVLNVANGSVQLIDQGSSNGTFVNGKLARSRSVRSGDRISVGEFILEVVGSRSSSNVIPFPSQQPIQMHGGMSGLPANGSFDQQQVLSEIAMGDAQPADLKGRALYYFERFVMPVFYGWMTKTEWKVILALMLFGLIMATQILGFTPVLQENQKSLVKEARKRASLIAREIADKNAPFVAQGAESKTEIGNIASDEGVRLAVLMDMKGRILAPPNRAGQQLLGEEGNTAVQAAKHFNNGRENGLSRVIDDSTLVVVEPLKVVDPSVAKNVTKAMALVALDLDLSTQGVGSIGLLFSESFIVSIAVMLLVLLALYRLTLKPFEVLNGDIDRILKGTSHQVSHEFKWKELDPLYDVIHSAVQRIPKESVDGDAEEALTSEELVRSLTPLTDTPGVGFLLFDENRKIASMNRHFEDLSGIRPENAFGQDLSAVARDDSIVALLKDMLDQAASGFSSSEEYDFSGILYRVVASGIGGKPPKVFMIVFTKKEE